MYESHREPVIPRRHFVRRLMLHFTPLIHRVLHRLHMDDGAADGDAP